MNNFENYSETFSFTNKFITKNNKPWFPVMGEIHYSRYPKQFWKEALLKMKAGGITVISSYTLWIHHEEIKGQWDFSDNKDLRTFVETIKECGLKMILRIGPWCHAECRNGGFPDWIIASDFAARTNDKKYFLEVERWYKKIFDQVSGLLHKDGGPIIGIQIENEFGHCGGLTGDDGEYHIGHLTEIAKKIGFDVPLYTATGWGGAITHGLLPVMGGYVDAPWDQCTDELEPSGNYVITYERNDHNIGSDYGLHTGITFDMTKYPYLTAELGGGLQPTFKRRPIPTQKDIGAETLVKLASGCNLLGYYMYHGGTNPKGKLSTLQESTETKYLNDLPELSYDFFAPLKEYGQLSKTYGELKLFSLFAKDFGSTLCQMEPNILEENPLSPNNKDKIRWSYRIDSNKSGFLFVNNYVRHQVQNNFNAKVFSIPQTDITFDSLNIQNQDYFFLPFNMQIKNSILTKAYATPLCTLNDDTFIFYENAATNQVKNIFEFKENKMPDAKIILLSKQDALNAFKVELNNTEHLIIFNGSLIQDKNKISLSSTETLPDSLNFLSYPPLVNTPKGYVACKIDNDFTLYSVQELIQHNAKIKVTARDTDNNFEQDKTVSFMELKNEYKADGKSFFDIQITDLKFLQNEFCKVSDYFVELFYNGSYARLYDATTKQLVADNLFCSKKVAWQIGLKRFITKDTTQLNFVLEVQGLNEKTPVYLEDKPVFVNGVARSFNSAKIYPEFTFSF